MKHTKLFEAFINEYVDFFTMELGYAPFGVIRHEDAIEIRDVHVSKDNHPKEPMDWFEFILADKKPLVFGKGKFKDDLADLEELCAELEIESTEFKNDKRLEKVRIKGDSKTLDRAFALAKKIAKTDY